MKLERPEGVREVELCPDRHHGRRVQSATQRTSSSMLPIHCVFSDKRGEASRDVCQVAYLRAVLDEYIWH